MNLTRSASQVSTTSELLQRNSGARWAAPKDDDPPSPPAKPPPLTKGKSTKIKRQGTSLALASGERVHMQAQAWGRGRHGQLGSIDEQSDGLRAQAAGLPQPIFTDVHVHAAACGADFLLVVPGIRPAGSQQGDQKRVLTPAEAVKAGASSLVVGRPITQAAEPRQAAAAILEEANAAAQ